MAHEFGKFFAEIRRERLQMSLRQLCADRGLDPGNISRMERGLIPPPAGRETLERYARALELEEGSDDWYTFFDLAASARGEIPVDLAERKDVLEKLPVLFRTLRGDRVDEEKLKDLLNAIRDA